MDCNERSTFLSRLYTLDPLRLDRRTVLDHSDWCGEGVALATVVLGASGVEEIRGGSMQTRCAGSAMRRGPRPEETLENMAVLKGLCTSSPSSAVASQLAPRGAWRHLVPVCTVVTVEGRGRSCSAPTEGRTAPTDDSAPAGEEATDSRLQGVEGAGVPGQKRHPR
ncbi:hypothetical protein AAFF_G00205920 [Aldrovandia affinis]|uniref:Uncharacterized protein n=1 Tax=Aldrovandia affinis TaxID=143900 RepID=A0AAD7RHK8_9TELE|nr:hypothetical protein AAFF_G00205920 [Aldrovandia affinis]